MDRNFSENSYVKNTTQSPRFVAVSFPIRRHSQAFQDFSQVILILLSKIADRTVIFSGEAREVKLKEEFTLYCQRRS